MAAIHIIKNDDRLPDISPIHPGANTFKSGYWVVSETTATSLIGGKIFFHEKQAKPSFFGGIITAMEVVTEGERAGRVIFTFDSDQACKGIRTPRDGWAQEMKIVL